MQVGISLKTKKIFNLMSEDEISNIENYINESLSKEYKEIHQEEINEIFRQQVVTFINNLTDDEKIVLRLYTGYDFRGINSLLRGIWNFDLNGKLNLEVIDKYKDLSSDLELIINKFPQLNMNFKTYRGVDIKAFHEYGIHTLNDLIYMKNHYYYESGFTSTSILRDTSFYNQDTEWAKNSNIEIEYYISEDSEDGALLLSDKLSYSKEQNEYLINSGSLIKILDVKIEEDRAFLKAILIPKKIWKNSIIKNENNIKKN